MRRIPKLTAPQRADVCAILSAGGTRRVAAAYAGCTVAAIHLTAEREPAFREQLHQAEARCEVKLLTFLQEAAKNKQQWRAASWLLERKYPQRYVLRPPDTVTLDQVSYLLSQFCDIVLADVPAELQETVRSRLNDLACQLGQAAGGKSPARKPPGRRTATHALPPPM